MQISLHERVSQEIYVIFMCFHILCVYSVITCVEKCYFTVVR